MTQVVNIQDVFDNLIDDAYLKDAEYKEVLIRELAFYRRTLECRSNLEKRVAELESVSQGLDAKIRTLLVHKLDDFLRAGRDILSRHEDFSQLICNTTACKALLRQEQTHFNTHYGDIVKWELRKRRLHDIEDILMQFRSISAHMRTARQMQDRDNYLGALQHLSLILKAQNNLKLPKRLQILDDIFLRTIEQIHQIPDEIVTSYVWKSSCLTHNDTRTMLNYMSVSIRLLDLSSVENDWVEQRIASQLSKCLVNCVRAYIMKTVGGSINRGPIDEKQLAQALQEVDATQAYTVILKAWEGFDRSLVLYSSCIHHCQHLNTNDIKKNHNVNWDILRGYLQRDCTKLLFAMFEILQTVLNSTPLPLIGPSASLSIKPLQLMSILSAVTCGIVDQFEPASQVNTSELENAFVKRLTREYDRLRYETLQELCDWLGQEHWRRVCFTRLQNISLTSEFDFASNRGLFSLHRCHILKLPAVLKLVKRPHAFANPSNWQHCAQGVADLIFQGTSYEEPNEQIKIGCELHHRILIALQDTIQALRIGPTLLGSAVAAVRDLWDFLIITTVQTFTPRSFVEEVLLIQELAHAPDNCVGGPDLYRAYSLFTKQQELFDLRALMLKIRNRRFRSDSSQKAMDSFFPSNYAPVVPECLSRAPAMYGCVERILAMAGVETVRAEVHQSFTLPLKESWLKYLSSNDARSIIRSEQDVDLVIAPLKSLILGQAAKQFIDFDGLWVAELKRICAGDVIEDSQHSDILVLQNTFKRHLGDAYRHLQILHAGSLPAALLEVFYGYIWEELNMASITALANITFIQEFDPNRDRTHNSRRWLSSQVDIMSEVFHSMLQNVVDTFGLSEKVEPFHPLLKAYIEAHRKSVGDIAKWLKTFETTKYEITQLMALLDHVAMTTTIANEEKKRLQRFKSETLQFVYRQSLKKQSPKDFLK